MPIDKTRVGEKPKIESDFNGELYFNHLKSEKSMSFGMASRKLNKKSAFWSYELAGGTAEWTIGNARNAGVIDLNGALGHVEGGYSFDSTKRIPVVKVKAGANVADFKAAAALRKSGIEYKVATADIKALGTSVSGGIGGATALPYAQASAYTVSPSIEAGPINIGIGDGANISGKADLLSFVGEKAIETPASINYSPLSASFDSKSSLGNLSAKIPGFGSIKKDKNGDPVIKTDFNSNGLSNYQGYLDLIKGQSGVEKGTPKNIYIINSNRERLIHQAESLHKKNTKTLKRIDGKDTWFAIRNNEHVADKSNGIVNRLNKAIDQSKIHKQEIDRKLAGSNLTPKESEKLSKQSKNLSEDINRMTVSREQMEHDRDNASYNLHRFNGSDRTNKSTDQILSEANSSVRNLESAYSKYGWSKQLGESAIEVCNSRNELNGRINRLDRQINENNALIDEIKQHRDSYLKENGKTFSDAISSGDKRIYEFNGYEKDLREENRNLRDEKGECQKALLENNKVFGAGDSEEIRAKGRELEATKIDKENNIVALDDKIADYCNSKGILLDSTYEESQTTDQGLKDLFEKKTALENEDSEKQREIDINKKAIIDAENRNACGFTVSECDGNAQLDYAEDKYGTHMQNNKDIRAGKEAESLLTEGYGSGNKSFEAENQHYNQASENENSQPIEKQNNPKDLSNTEADSKTTDPSRQEKDFSNSHRENDNEHHDTTRGMPSTNERESVNEPQTASQGMPSTNVSESVNEPQRTSQGMPSKNVAENSGVTEGSSSCIPTMSHGNTEKAPDITLNGSKSIGQSN